MHLTNDAVAAFVGGNADGAAAESRLVAGLDGWDGCRVGIADRRDETTGETKGAGSSPKLFVRGRRGRVSFH